MKIVINGLQTTELKQFFDLRGNVKDVRIFYRKLVGVPQGEADSYCHFSIPLYNDDTELISQVDLDISSDKTVQSLLDLLKSRDDVPNECTLRMVLLNRSSIEKTVDVQEKLSNYVGKEIRVEIVPQVQLENDGNSFLIRCAFSYNEQYPPSGTMLIPFNCFSLIYHCYQLIYHCYHLIYHYL